MFSPMPRTALGDVTHGRAKGRAVVLTLAIIACSLFWAGSAPAHLSPSTDVDTNVHYDEGSDAGSEVPLAPPESDESHPESGSDLPLNVPEAHSLPMPYLANPDEVTDMPVTFRAHTPLLQEPGVHHDPPRRARPLATDWQEGGASSQPVASSSSSIEMAPGTQQWQQQGQQDPARLPPSSDPRPLPAHGLPQPQVHGSYQENVYNMATPHQPPQQPVLPHQQHMAAYMPWSAWDEEYDAPPQQQLPPTSQTPTTPTHSTIRLGYANQYDPSTDPWHEEGQLGDDEVQHNPMAPYLAPHQRLHAPPRPPDGDQMPQDHPTQQQQQQSGPGDLQPPTMDPWHSLTRELASTGPLLPPSQWAHNNAMAAASHQYRCTGRHPTSPWRRCSRTRS